MEKRPQLIALVGGSGAGKTWLSRRLHRHLGPLVTRLTLDDFFHDRAAVPASLRTRTTMDNPRSVDWRAFKRVLQQCREDHRVNVPKFSVPTRTRLLEMRSFIPGPLVVVDGLWLLLRRDIRQLFDFSVFLDCPAQLRMERRLALAHETDPAHVEAARRHFLNVVLPLHERYVAPQAALADIVMTQPPSDEEVENLAETLRALAQPEAPFLETSIEPAWPLHTQRL